MAASCQSDMCATRQANGSHHDGTRYQRIDHVAEGLSQRSDVPVGRLIRQRLEESKGDPQRVLRQASTVGGPPDLSSRKGFFGSNEGNCRAQASAVSCSQAQPNRFLPTNRESSSPRLVHLPIEPYKFFYCQCVLCATFAGAASCKNPQTIAVQWFASAAPFA
jgi:hypothetical protein